MLSDIVVSRMATQRISKAFPIINTEAKAQKEGGFAAPITMGKREQILGDLALGNDCLRIVWYVDRILCRSSHAASSSISSAERRSPKADKLQHLLRMYRYHRCPLAHEHVRSALLFAIVAYSGPKNLHSQSARVR